MDEEIDKWWCLESMKRKEVGVSGISGDTRVRGQWACVVSKSKGGLTVLGLNSKEW